MILWGGVKEVLRVHGALERDRSKLRESTSHTSDDVAQDREESPETHKKDSSAQQVCL